VSREKTRTNRSTTNRSNPPANSSSKTWDAAIRDSLIDRIRIYIDPANADEIWTNARYEQREGSRL